MIDEQEVSEEDGEKYAMVKTDLISEQKSLIYPNKCKEWKWD